MSNLDYNWQASILLLANLNHAIDTEVSPEMYAIYVDLYLKSLAPYFNIARCVIVICRNLINDIYPFSCFGVIKIFFQSSFYRLNNSLSH